MRRILAIVAAVLFLAPSISYALPAFPGAEGFGTNTNIGGRAANAKLYKVDRLTDSSGSGVGSCTGNICTGDLRYALRASGPRIVIFTVSGIIPFNSPIDISNPYITIAGQTAPGGGIAVRDYWIKNQSHDVIIRGMRFRIGTKLWETNYPPWFNKEMWLMINDTSGAPIYNVTIDHNSFSWWNDDGIWNWTTGGTAYRIHDITWSNNLVGEALFLYNDLSSNWDLGKGAMVGGGIGWGASEKNYNVSYHHNAFIHVGSRIPHACGWAETEWINNYIYDFGPWGYVNQVAGTYAGIKNRYENGPGNLAPNTHYEGRITYNSCSGATTAGILDSSIYVSGNRSYHRPNDTLNERLIFSNYASESAKFTDTPPFTLSNVTITDVDSLKSQLLAPKGVGAIIPERDSVDQRMIARAQAGTSPTTNISECGSPGGASCDWPQTVATWGGWPTYASGSYPTDTDSDGMPDSWETAHNLNPNDSSDWNDIAASGYLNIEEYINSFFTTEQDTTPPVRYNGTPGSLPSGTTQTTVSLTTSESATCRWSATPGTSFNNMTHQFDGGGTGSHSTIVGSTTYTDDFNRTDENPINSNWSKSASSENDIQIVSNTAKGTAGHDRNMAHYSGSASPADQCSQVKTYPYSGTYTMGPTVRIQGGSQTYPTGYIFQVTDTQSLRIYRFNGDGTSSQVGGSTTTTVNSGDILKICMDGQLITTYLNGSPVSAVTGTDSMWTSGYPGIYEYYTETYMDDWQANGISALADGNNYTYYVRCQDDSLNQNTDDFEISFNVLGGGGGGGSLPLGTFRIRGVIR